MSPGTAFMFKLTKRLSKEIKKGTFSKNNPDLYFILSSGDVQVKENINLCLLSEDYLKKITIKIKK